MSNKTQLQTNNASLDGYIARINAAKEVAASLPEAGSSGGGSVETCTVGFTFIDYVNDNPGTLYYMKPDMSLGVATYQASREEFVPPTEVTVIKNSIVAIGDYSLFEGLMLHSIPDHCEILCESPYGMTFYITGDSEISLTNA